MRHSPLVAVVILNWNNAPDTLACLASTAKLQYDNYDVIVVDNGSTDNSVEQIRSAYPDITLLALPQNLGYAAGNNEGIYRAIKEGADYVFVLNNDTLLAPDLLSRLVQVAETNPQIGMVGPKMYCTEPEDAIFAAGSVIDWDKGRTFHRGMYLPDSSYPNGTEPAAVDFIAGCGVLVSSAMINAVGALDLSYYLNFEDVEWCVRARQRGFGVWYVPQAKLWHKVSATMGQNSPTNTYYMTRNALIFFWTNLPPLHRYKPIWHIIIRTLRTITAWSLKKQYRTEKYRRLRCANLYALRDFFQGKTGQMGEDVAAICSKS